MKIGKRIGSGTFSEVFENSEDDKKVFVFSCDKVKEFQALFYTKKSNRFLSYELIAPPSEESNWLPVYSCERVKNESEFSLESDLLEEELALYRSLRALTVDCGTRDAKAIASSLRGRGDAQMALVEFIDEFCEWCGDGLRFEISARNVSIKKNRLVFLDVFYLSGQVLG